MTSKRPPSCMHAVAQPAVAAQVPKARRQPQLTFILGSVNRSSRCAAQAAAESAHLLHFVAQPAVAAKAPGPHAAVRRNRYSVVVAHRNLQCKESFGTAT